MSRVCRSALGTPYMPAWTSMDSRGVKKTSAAISWATTPMQARASRGRSSMSRSQILTVPLDLRTSPARMLMKVDLPAPFGPRRPKIEPLGICRSTPLRAVLAGVVLVAL